MKLIDADALIDMCKKAADANMKLYELSLDSKRCNTMDMAAIAFFGRQYEMYSYVIPGLINTLIEEMESVDE